MPPDQQCANCKFYRTVTSWTWRTDSKNRGLCLRGTPAVVANRIDPGTDDGRWPLCLATEWCGEWEKA